MDGMELARRIKNQPAMESVRVLMLTSFARREDIKVAKEAGISGSPSSYERTTSTVA